MVEACKPSSQPGAVGGLESVGLWLAVVALESPTGEPCL